MYQTYLQFSIGPTELLIALVVLAGLVVGAAKILKLLFAALSN